MTVTKRGQTLEGVPIQIENWREDYPSVFSENDTIAAYPISRWSFSGTFSPKGGERFRAELRFSNAKECEEAFDLLSRGEKTLADYLDRMSRREYAKAITGGMT